MFVKLIPDDICYRLLKEIAENPDVSQRTLAKTTGFSLGKTNYYLKALIDAGWVKVGNFARSTNKFNYVYVLTPSGIAEKTEVTLRFLKKKQQQYKQLEKEIEELRGEAKNNIGKRHDL